MDDGKQVMVVLKSSPTLSDREQLQRIEAGQARIEAKLDALLDALLDEQGDDEPPSLTLDGDEVGGERDGNQPL